MLRSSHACLRAEGPSCSKFQAACHLAGAFSRDDAYVLLRRLGVPAGVLLGRLALDPIRTVALSEPRVRAGVMRAGGTVVATADDDATAPHVPSRRYVITHA